MINAPHKAPSYGFTLVELMIVVVILAILVAIAVPSFNDTTRRNTIESLQSNVTSAIATARTEAASRNTFVTMCVANAAGDNCDTTASSAVWGNGWIVFEDANNNQEVDGDEASRIIDVYQHDASAGYEFNVTDSGSSAVTELTFNPQGFRTTSENVLFRVCGPNDEAKYARGAFVTASGLVVKTQDGDDSGVHDDPNNAGNDLSC